MFLQFITVVAVYKHFSMLNNETESNLTITRASSTSTPISSSESLYSQFLKQEGSLCFNHDKSYYSQLLEETDDALLRWYPMYISYSREERALSLNKALADKGYETFLHLQGQMYNIVFVHAMKIQLKLLKRFDTSCQCLKFITVQQRFESQGTKVIWVPDAQMENFIDAATRPDPESQRIPLTYNEFIHKEGKSVRILSGPFAGIEGEIKRIARHRIVVALLRDAKIAIGITHIPPENLEFI